MTWAVVSGAGPRLATVGAPGWVVAAGGGSVTNFPASDAGVVAVSFAVPVLASWSWATVLPCSGYHTRTSTFGAIFPAVTRGRNSQRFCVKVSATGDPVAVVTDDAG